MALLKSATNSLGVDLQEYRDELYYSQYQYRCRITIPHFRRAQYYAPDEFEQMVLGKSKKIIRIEQDERDILIHHLPSIKTVLQYRIDSKKNKSSKVRGEYDTISVFSNDLQSLHDNFDKLTDVCVDFTEAVTTGYSGVKTFANEPKHNYRIYFKSKRIPEDFKDGLKKILTTNTQLRPSPALKMWLYQKEDSQWYWNLRYLSSSYFIDYNDESYLSYLALMYDGMLGRKYKLQKRADIV